MVEQMKSSTAGSSLMLYPMPDVRPPKTRTDTRLAVVDQICDKLWPDKDWRKYLNAVTNKSAVERKFESDRTMAAARIRAEAIKMGSTAVTSATPLAFIMRDIETLMRRDKLGRNQRLLAMNTGAATA